MRFRINEGATITSVASPAASQSNHSDAHLRSGSQTPDLSTVFLMCGMILSFVGAILPIWGYHLREDLSQAGEYFLSLNVGFWCAQACGREVLDGKKLKFTLTVANVTACLAFLFLALFPATSIAWRLWGVLWLGISAGLLHLSILSITGGSSTPAHRAWAWLGLGCALTALLAAGTYYAYSVPMILVLFAIVPGVYAGYSLKTSFPRRAVPMPSPLFQTFRKLNHPAVVLFALLLFVQFGNEWSVGGWLSLFLIRRLGISPPQALLLLSLYWLVLMAARPGFQFIVSRLRPGLALGGSVLASLLGTIVLACTNNRFGAIMGLLFAAAGFGSMYQLIAQRMIRRFAPDQAGWYDAVFLLGIAGGLLAPWLLGYLADAWGMAAVMIAPMLGTTAVFVLMLLTMLEAKLSGSPV